MSHLYSLEFFIQNIDIGKNLEVINANIICGNLFNFTITLIRSKLDAFKSEGKAIFFASPIDEVISSFTTNFNVTIKDPSGKEILGSAQVPMDNSFAETISKVKNNVIIERNVNISNEDASIGTLSCKMCLANYGNSVEIPINKFGSQLAIPLNFRKTMEALEPIFFQKNDARKSTLDSQLMIYAQMANISAQPIYTLLTPEYINRHLCGHKSCPGAKKFKEYGLGPLAPAGSGLGSISSIKDTKSCGIYGMSQSYGTLDNYGAYGLFVKKPKNPKTCCGSPDCPYTILFGKPEESIVENAGEDSVTSPSSEQYDNQFSPRGSNPRGSNLTPRSSYPRQSYTEEKKCTCKQCKGSHRSKQSSKDSGTCGSPSCPKKEPKPVKCPFLNKPPRQPAGADRNPNCPNYGKNKATRRNYGHTEECMPSNCPNPAYSHTQPRTSQISNTVGACGGQICPFHKVPGTCPGADTCPFISCLGPGQLRPAKLEPVEEKRPSKVKKKCCSNKKCDYFEENENTIDGEEEGGDGLCSGKVCPLDRKSYGDDGDKRRKPSILKNKHCLDKTCTYFQEAEEEIPTEQENYDSDALCGGKICPLERPSYRGYSDDTKRTKLSLLIGEEGKKLLFGTDGGFDVPRDLLTTLSLGDNTDIYYIISRLLGDRKQSNALSNYLPTGSSPDFKNFDKVERKKQKRKGPCKKDSCKMFKYKTCSECGGLSRSGATCDNTDVSFSTISYDSNECPVEQSELPQEPPKIEGKSALKKQETSEQPEKTVQIIRTPKNKKTRFVYIGGDEYPGVKIGHKTCGFPMKFHRNVPARMGWLWNAEKRKKSWRPGFLEKEIEERIVANRRAKGIPDPPEIKAIEKKKRSDGGYCGSDEEEEEEIVPKPTLIIQKKDGNYLITLHPLKDPKTLVDRENPYMRCKPIQFIITKPKKPPPPIITRYAEIDTEYEGEGEDYIPLYNNTCLCDEPDNVSSSSSDSELNIEFTTPAGIIIPERMKRPPNVVNAPTQFLDADFHCEDCPIIIPKKFKKEKKKRK